MMTRDLRPFTSRTLMAIHPTALVAPGAVVHPRAEIGPFCIVDPGAVVGAECILDSAVRIYAHTRLGQGNRVGHGATLGSAPQDLGYLPEHARPLIIGDGNCFKEGVNVSHGIKSAAGTRIGNHNYFMAFAHVGHDCIVGDHNVFANTATLGGHVEMADRIFVSGQVVVHQFCRIGAYAMVGGASAVTQDVPPYALVNGQRARILGINVVGLRRHGFTPAQRQRIKAAYRLLWRAGLPRAAALARIATELSGTEIDTLLAFLRAASSRGIMGFARAEAPAE